LGLAKTHGTSMLIVLASDMLRSCSWRCGISLSITLKDVLD
jgi:hypothetical protein